MADDVGEIFGLPHLGQAGAESECSNPQSGQIIKPMANPFLVITLSINVHNDPFVAIILIPLVCFRSCFLILI